MNGKIGLLGGLLAAQLLIVAGMVLSSGFGSDAQAERFLAFAPGEVARLTVSDAEGSVALQRTTAEADAGQDALAGKAAAEDANAALVDDADADAGALEEAGAADGPAATTWRLENSLPADHDKVNDLLDKLADLAAPWPVATSVDSAERFEVTEDKHQRRLLLEDADGVVADVFLGTSPGYRRVHARAADEDEVYSIDFSNYEAPTDADQWLDKALLAAAGDPISIIHEGSWHLTRTEGAEADGAAHAEEADASGEDAEPGQSDIAAAEVDRVQWLIDGGPADPAAADQLVRRFQDLRVLGTAEAAGESKAVFLVTDDDGEHRLELFHEEDDEKYNVISSRREGRFELATYVAEQMLVEASDLLPGSEEGNPEDNPEAQEDLPSTAGSA